MAVDRRIWPAGEALLDLVYSLILGIPVAYRKLGPLLEIDDDGHRHPGSARPARVGRRARVAEQIASSGPCLTDLRHSIVLNRRPMDYRLPVTENDTDGASHGGEPRYRQCRSSRLFLTGRARKAQEPGRWQKKFASTRST